jgi:hypothetical protein
MTLREHQEAFARDVADLLKHIFDSGYTCTLGETVRLKECPHCKGKLAKPLSLHPDRLAIDINLFKDGKWLQNTSAHRHFGEYWKTLSSYNEWGGEGDRNDGNHYSRSPNGERW